MELSPNKCSSELARFAKSALLVVFGAVFFFMNIGVAEAGFGITPPYVSNDRLTRGTVYEQRIGLVRSNPDEELKVEITMNVPGIEDWFTIDKGKEFIIPKGAPNLPITITVNVPSDAEYKEYKGAIRIRTTPNTEQPSGGVSIALGAQIDVRLKVVDKIYDFNVRKISVGDIEEGRTRWGFYFPGKIRFFMMIENTGNTDYGPTKVHFDIYDSEGETLLESIDNTNEMDVIAPFATKDITAELPTRLPPGRYNAKYTIYKGDEIASQNEVTLSINPLGSIPGYEGYGFEGLAFEDKVKVALTVGVPLSLLVTLIGIVVSKRKRRGGRRRRMKAYPYTTQLK